MRKLHDHARVLVGLVADGLSAVRRGTRLLVEFLPRGLEIFLVISWPALLGALVYTYAPPGIDEAGPGVGLLGVVGTSLVATLSESIHPRSNWYTGTSLGDSLPCRAARALRDAYNERLDNVRRRR